MVKRYPIDWLGSDIRAGLATAGVVLPQAMAYATLAGLPVQAGLYCALVPMVVYALLGTSRPLSVSTTSTISVLTAIAVAATGGESDPMTAAATLAVLTGLLLLVAALFRLGFLADFISQPVIAGFKVGVGLVIATSQLGKITGLDVAGDGFFDRILSTIEQVSAIHVLTLVVAIGTILALLLVRRWPVLPGPLVVVVAAVALSAALDLGGHGVATVGSVPRGLPGPRLPDAALARELLPVALGIALLAFLESIAAARAFRLRADPPLNTDRELFALGLANLGGGIFQAYPAAGGMSQTAVNDKFGARSQLAELVTAACTVLVLFLLAPLVGPLPQATLGGLVLVIAAGLMDVRALRRIRQVRPGEFWLAVLALLCGATLGILAAVLVTSLLSLLILLYETNHPTVTSGQPAPGLVVVRVESRLYFANVRRVMERALRLTEQAEPWPRVVLLDLSAVTDLDYTAAELVEEFHDELQHRRTALWFAQPEVRPTELLRRSGAWDRLDQEDRLFDSVEHAVAHYRRHG